VNQNNHIDILIGKFVSGNATSEEIQQLEDWKTSDDQNQRLVEESRKAWDKAGYYISENTLQSDKYTVQTGYNRYLSNKIRSISRQSFIYKIAAILAFPIALAIGWLMFGDSGKSVQLSEQICEISSPKGHVSKVVLPDGTEVWINTNSSIIYDASAFNSHNREIQLIGEAYFEVTSSEEKPFIVNTPHATVKVTGTAFNVNASLESQTFEAVLAEGNIQLEFETGKRNPFNMNPGQRIIYHAEKNDLVVQQVDARMFSSWRNGELLFKDATLSDLIKELERIYDIKFHLVPENLGNFRFRGMFSYNNNLIEALEKIKKTSAIDYYIENKEVWLKKSNK